jgi:hypothetical protein
MPSSISKRKQPEAATEEAAPPSALDRYNGLISEQQQIHATLEEHQRERDRLLREDGTLIGSEP